MAQHAGTAHWFNNAKGYEFLGRDDGPHVFRHYSSMQTDGYSTLKEEEAVQCDIIQVEDGSQADQVPWLQEKA